VGADAAVLPVVADDERDLGHVRPLVEVVAADRDDVLAVRFRDGADDRDVGAMVDEHVVLDLAAGHLLRTRHEPVVDRLLRQRVEEVEHERLVGRVDGSEGDLGAVVEHAGGVQVLGTDQELALDAGELGAQVARLDGLLEQAAAEVRMGDRDQRDRPFLHALAVEVGDAVLGHHVVHVATGCADAAAGAQARDDARDAAFLGGGVEGDDRLAVRGARRAAVEVDLPADARVELAAQRVGGHLPGEVDLEGDVDRHLAVLATDDERIVHVLRRVEREGRVVVHVVVETAAAEAEAGHHLVAVDRLLAAGRDPGLDQVDHRVREHLGVDAEVLLSLQVLDDRLRDAGRCRTRPSSRRRRGRPRTGRCGGCPRRVPVRRTRPGRRRPAPARRCRARG
jgi:hypothetical protein